MGIVLPESPPMVMPVKSGVGVINTIATDDGESERYIRL